VSQVKSNEEEPTYAARTPTKLWGQPNGPNPGKNFACHKGSDLHCHETFGEEYCCASYRSLA
jgi:hypothetical protein